MDIISDINKAVVKALNNEKKLCKVVLGKEQQECLKKQLDDLTDDLSDVETDKIISIELEYVDEDSYFETISEESV